MTRPAASRPRTAVFLVAALAFVLAAGVARAAPAPDAWITTRMKIALITTGGVAPGSMHVDTVEGRVTLLGSVSTQAQKDRVEALARALPGVKALSSHLSVIEVARHYSADDTDARIKDTLGKLLREDRGATHDRITVKSVRGGVVVLAGKSVTLSSQLRAVEAAGEVSGVRGVASEIRSPANETSEFAAAPRHNEARQTVLDDWITRATKLRLLADPEVPALHISVDTHNGVVALFGEVPSTAVKLAAGTDARSVEGVIGLDDLLVVDAAAAEKPAEVADDVVKQAVTDAFSTLPDKKHIAVEVQNGVAHLTGTVASGWQSLYAATMAREVRGVRFVKDDLQF